MNTKFLHLCFATCGALLVINIPGQAAPQNSSKVPVMDGGAGPCSVELTVLGADSKPVYDATVKVHIAYGFAGAHRLDLQAGTNADGKVKFTGLPSRVHRPPLEFQASKSELEATLDYDPTTECSANHEITLQKPKPAESQ
ncbi:MAG TPA: hypothetical protein VFA90_07120 [Terriglobales bacterium]|nr:hypothetical protein [Terriglobales bacterium]